MVLEKIQKANDVKKLKPEELPVLAEDPEVPDREDQRYRRASRVQFRCC